MAIQLVKIPFTGTYIKQGDTIPKIVFSFGEDDVIDLTNAVIKMQLFKGKQKVFDVATESGITILDAKSFQVDEVAKENNTFPPGKFLGDLEITIGGKRLTYFNIEYTVIEEFTK